MAGSGSQLTAMAIFTTNASNACCFSEAPDGPQFVILKSSVPRPVLRLRLGHPAHDGGAEVNPAAGVPGHQPAQQCQQVIRHHRPVVILDLSSRRLISERLISSIWRLPSLGRGSARRSGAHSLKLPSSFFFSSPSRYSSAMPFNV
jgi:hypothetical protein